MTRAAYGDTLSYLRGPSQDAARIADVVVSVNPDGTALTSSIYPPTAVALTAGSGNVANAIATATLTGTASTTVYVTGFSITGSGATAGLVVTVTLAGVIGGTKSYTYTFQTGAAVGNTALSYDFSLPVPAAAINTPIVITCPASGAGGTNNTIVARGFYV